MASVKDARLEVICQNRNTKEERGLCTASPCVNEAQWEGTLPAGGSSGRAVRCSGQSQVALVQQLQQLLLCGSAQCCQTANENPC